MAEPTQNEQYIRVRRGDVDSICLYSVTEDELEILEKGSPGSLYLNFSLSLISIATSFLASLFLTNISSQRIYIVFVIITVIGYIIGFFLLLLWYKEHRSSTSVAKRIRERLKADVSPVRSDGDSIKPVA